MHRWRRGPGPGLVPWAAALAATVVLMVVHPFKGDLDRGTILAIAGLILGIAAVTVGLVSVLAQHLSETYAGSLVTALLRRSTWQTAALAEGVSLLAVIAFALWRADLTTGAVAGVALCASLVASWSALFHLFRHFDPLGLVALQTQDALRRLQVEHGAPAAAREPSQSILSLILNGARKGDTDVVRAGLSAWNAILECYLQVHTVVWDDEYFYWLYARIEELIEQNARESVSLVLPAIVEGIALLGSTTAKFPNPLNASLDEGTTLMTEALEHIISLTATARRSPAARMAARAIGDVGASCLEAEKFTVAQAPVEALLRIGVGTADKLPDVAREAVIGLSRLLLSLAESDSNDVMRGANAERIVEGLSAIIEREGHGRLGPSYVLVAPMSDISIARLCQTMATAKERHDHGYRQRKGTPWSLPSPSCAR